MTLARLRESKTKVFRLFNDSTRATAGARTLSRAWRRGSNSKAVRSAHACGFSTPVYAVVKGSACESAHIFLRPRGMRWHSSAIGWRLPTT